MKKILFLMSISLLLFACNDDKKVTEITEFVIENASFDLQVSSGVQLMYATADGGQVTGGQITWTSSDETIATVDDGGYVTGIAEGNATITGTLKNGFTADAKVRVLTKQQYYKDNAEFLSLGFFGQPTATPYEFKKKDGSPLTCGDIAADTTGLTEEVKNAPIDSAYVLPFGLINTDLFITDQGLSGTGGLLVNFQTSCYYSAKGKAIFSLSVYSFIDVDTIGTDSGAEKPGKPEDMNFPYPYYAQVTDFDKSNYEKLFNALLNGEKVTFDDYPYYGDEDAYLLDYFVDSETNELGAVFYGKINGGWVQIGQDADRNYMAEAYQIEGEFLGGPSPYGLHCEYLTVENDDVEQDGFYHVKNEDGLYYMEEMESFSFTKGGTQAAPAQKFISIPVDAMRKQVAINNAMFIPLRMAQDKLQVAR